MNMALLATMEREMMIHSSTAFDSPVYKLPTPQRVKIRLQIGVRTREII